MTITDITNKVADRLNLTSTQALTRITDSANIGYRKAASSCGIKLIERTIGVAATTVIGNQSLTFSAATTTPSTNVQKILSLYNTAFTPIMVLDEVSFDTLRNELPQTDPPAEYAMQSSTSNSVTVFLNSIPATNYALTIDCMANLSTLSGTMVPALPEDFHDMLVDYALAIELHKMEKPELAVVHMSGSTDNPGLFEQRLSELRYYYACSAYNDIYQGKNEQLSVSRQVPLV
jgi:hypothetical protein